jgi:DNA-binding transcriptional ArsR family regulator
MSDYVAKPDFRILNVLAGLAASFERLWCFPNQATIVRLLALHHGITMSRRALNRHLGALERDGYIDRQRRHAKKKTGTLILHSTLYKIKGHAVQTIAKLSRFLSIAAAHKWASRWISAVPKEAQRIDLQINIMPSPPKKQADSG